MHWCVSLSEDWTLKDRPYFKQRIKYKVKLDLSSEIFLEISYYKDWKNGKSAS